MKNFLMISLLIVSTQSARAESQTETSQFIKIAATLNLLNANHQLTQKLTDKLVFADSAAQIPQDKNKIIISKNFWTSARNTEKQALVAAVIKQIDQKD